MIPKARKLTGEQLRPIALNNYSYNIFMSIIRNKIEEHICRNNETVEVQSGFTKGCRIENNLLIQYYNTA